MDSALKTELNNNGNDKKTKHEIVGDYRDELAMLRNVISHKRDKWKCAIEYINYRDSLELILATNYLNKYPELYDKDCSGRGLPAFNAKEIKGINS